MPNFESLKNTTRIIVGMAMSMLSSSTKQNTRAYTIAKLYTKLCTSIYTIEISNGRSVEL